MYGLIHKALQDMVLESYGEEKWGEILRVAGASDDDFVTMKSYSDDVSYGLVGAASEVLGAPAEDCLESFGYYWLIKAAPTSYEGLLGAIGDDVYEFLGSVNNLHDRITTTFVDYKPPSFKAEFLENKRVKWHYQSTRIGLTPFVKGLIKAIAERFEIEITIEKIEPVEIAEGEYTIFHLHIID